MSNRLIKAESFQPTVENSKRLGKLKKQRGLMSRTINTALDCHFAGGVDKTLAELTLKILNDLDGPTGASGKDVLHARTICEEALAK